MKKKGWFAFFKRKQYVIAATLVIIAAVGTTALYSSRQEKERERMEAELAEELNEQAEQLAEEGTEQSAAVSAVIPPKNSEKKENKEEDTPEETKEAEVEEETETEETETEEEKVAKEVEETGATANTLHFSPENGLMWPMEGNVVVNYSMDQTVYFPTLDQYKYNPAIIIAGDVNQKVYAAARGQVKSIENDEVTGCTVTLDLGDGYEAIYGQLKELNFAEGDYVEAGHVLGYIGEPTKYFSVEGSNLYFELQENGAPIDPVEFFN